MPTSADLTFLHLSDIHFRKGFAGSSNDPDIEIRDRLDFDLRRLVPRFGDFSGIIITGDVAWSGHKQEYDYATAWIQELAGHLRCDLSTVMVIPGNHDVDRKALGRNDSAILKLQRKLLGHDDAAKADARLLNALTGKSAKLLAAPIKPYNTFAKRFNCAITPRNPYWQRSFKLGDGTTLLIRGITSTWLSGPRDSETTARLLYGSGQYAFTKIDNTHYIAAAHHPPQNMLDGDEATHALDHHCRVQLFGHKHIQWISDSRTTTRIVSGALQPDRRVPPWIPRYNILQITGQLADKTNLLKVDVYPRCWSREFRQFMADYTPDAADVRHFEFFPS